MTDYESTIKVQIKMRELKVGIWTKSYMQLSAVGLGLLYGSITDLVLPDSD